ncbi:SWI/SNF-related matrix-associated actin-dependent regulator of chromatin subfamily A-like protein 1 [Nematocida displodere]|uniref:SWI/SNF-related matrix-associated actin-dependent regulator of chromatin subfamily A-like protein 1 n=1 Tax=Nematocida displodere TaxID=1805483 RepID=A0A177EE89_9MICR|nr:SWI/SNF-related matrix-associated actin-dependent regulator of chromatin subfamily A-like protein 1 [Nematocida displodere]
MPKEEEVLTRLKEQGLPGFSGAKGGGPVQPTRYTVSLLSGSQLKIFPSTKQVAEHLYHEERATFSVASNTWTFPVTAWEGLQRSLPALSVSGPPNSLIAYLAAKQREKGGAGGDEIATCLFIRGSTEKIDLFPFQQDSVRQAAQQNYRILIADDMGLGKTIQAIAIATTYMKNHGTQGRALLVIAPATLRADWGVEAVKYLTDRACSVEEYLATKENTGGEVVVVIDTYQMVTKKIERLDEKCFFMAIVDESHSLKNSESQRGTHIVPFLVQMKHVVLLSGTPALSRPLELFTQISIAAPGMFNEREYSERYCRISEAHEKRLKPTFRMGLRHTLYTGERNPEELRIAISSFFIRRTKSEVLRLAPKRRVKVLFNTELARPRKNLAITDHPTQDKLAEFRAAAIEKQPDTLEYLKNFRQQTQDKIIVFAHHVDFLSAIFAGFSDRAIKIDGSTPTAKRSQILNQFKTDPKIDVAVLSLTTCSAGLNLTCANIVIFAELFWTPGDIFQAENRVHRIGQQKKVEVYYLIGSWSDHGMWLKMLSKEKTLKNIGVSDIALKNIETAEFTPGQKSLLMYNTHQASTKNAF